MPCRHSFTEKRSVSQTCVRWQERPFRGCGAMLVCYVEILHKLSSQKNSTPSADFPFTTEWDSSDCSFICHELWLDFDLLPRKKYICGTKLRKCRLPKDISLVDDCKKNTYGFIYSTVMQAQVTHPTHFCRHWESYNMEHSQRFFCETNWSSGWRHLVVEWTYF